MAIVLIVLMVFLFSVVIQAQQIKSLVYNQQASFFTHEAEETVIIFNQNENERVVINEKI